VAEPSDYQYVPGSVLEAADRQDRADQWAAKARADLATRWGDAAGAPVSTPTSAQDLKDSQPWPASTPPEAISPGPFAQPAAGGSAPSAKGDFGPSVITSQPMSDAPSPSAATWAPSAAARQVPGWTPPTTAAISGGVPRTVSQTGGAFYGLDDQGVQTVSAAGDIARQAGYGDEGARALQSVLLTEGGLTGARGDYGKSAGPLQFLRDKGMLPAFASFLGKNQDEAAAYAEQNPLEAIRWAVGTNDQPGYLGAGQTLL
jgi:hypothetical protein